MFKSTIQQSLKNILINISINNNIDENLLLNHYFPKNNLLITHYTHPDFDYTFLKDCFNNLFVVKNENHLELIGYINNNEIIVNKNFKQSIKKKEKEKKLKKKINSKLNTTK
jgi:hypothetical protein